MAEYIANRDNDEDICKYQVAEWCEDEISILYDLITVGLVEKVGEENV